jgi:hypothetical protein
MVSGAGEDKLSLQTLELTTFRESVLTHVFTII